MNHTVIVVTCTLSLLVACILVLVAVWWSTLGFDRPKALPRDVVLIPPLPFGQLIDERIDLRYIPDFLTTDQCNQLIERSKDKFTRSKVIEGADHKYVTDARTSHSYSFTSAHELTDPTILSITQRVSELVQLTPAHVEGLQVVRYQPGDYFKPHHDWFKDDYSQSVNNQRQYTFFVYLNNVNGEGGETDFPELGRSFRPKQGDALFWRNCAHPSSCLKDSLHQGKPPVSDVKYGLNIWIRFYPD